MVPGAVPCAFMRTLRDRLHTARRRLTRAAFRGTNQATYRVLMTPKSRNFFLCSLGYVRAHRATPYSAASELLAHLFKSMSVAQDYVRLPLKGLIRHQQSVFMSFWATSTHPVGFGKLQAKNPPMCRPSHAAFSAWLHLTLSEWKQAFPPQHGVPSRPRSHILPFLFLFLMQLWGRKDLLHQSCEKTVTKLTPVTESQPLSCSCLMFYIPSIPH